MKLLVSALCAALLAFAALPAAAKRGQPRGSAP
jgi:hypothetical protein